MRLVDGRVTHYRSINDSGVVAFDPEVTCIVGPAGSGKTSFLRMLSGVSDRFGFGEVDLPRGSGIVAKLRGGRVRAGGITQLVATFRVEEADRPRLPPEHRGASLVAVRRTLAGRIELSVDGRALARADVRREVGAMLRHAGQVTELVGPPGGEGSEGGPAPALTVDEAISGLREADFFDRDSVVLAIQTLRMAALSAWPERKARARIESELDRIEAIGLDMASNIEADPWSAVYRVVPKPWYCGGVFEMEDEVDLDKFVADPFASKTFACVAQVCGLTTAGVSKARNAPPERRDEYLATRSELLSSRLGRFWRQGDYTFRLEIDGGRLLLHVSDRTTGTATPPSERSDGFRWRMAFFLDLSAFLASEPGRSVILLDNPATELHEGAKGDVLRFMREAARSDLVQVVYSTHERALVDPWRTDRIRVAHLTPEGTKIMTVQAASAGSTIEAVMGSIGSPARYSLFGAPRTVCFDEDSGMYIAAAVNEYLYMSDPEAALDKDAYSITSSGGAAAARHALAMYKGAGLDFVMVAGRVGGEETRGIRPGELERHFVEIPAVAGGGEAGMEDLVDRSLYYEAFREAYRGILVRIPPIDEIDADGGRKRADNYRRWLEKSGEQYGRTLVAQRMFGVVIGGGEPARSDPGRAEALERTGRAFAGLFAAIKAKYEDKAADA